MTSPVITQQGGSHQPMSERLRSLLSSARYVSILLALSLVGYFGHRTHWEFGITGHVPSQAAHESDSSPSDLVLESEPFSDGWEITFPSERSLKKSGVATSLVQQRPMTERVSATGVIAYNQRLSASLSARVSGTVWRVIKQAGDSVRRGDVLVVIDAVEVGRAKSDFLSTLVTVESRADALSMLEKVSGAVPERQVREARVALREAKIRLLNTEQTLVNLGLSLRQAEYEQLSDIERAAKIHFLGLPEPITKDLDLANTTSNLLPLTASFDGVLIHHDATLDEMVEAEKPFLELVDTSRMWLKLDVPKEDAEKLALGLPVTFCPDGLNDELQSKVSWIGTEVDAQTRTLQVRAEVDNPTISSDPQSGHEVRRLRANTFGTGSNTLRESSQTLAVPVSAVIHADDQPLVFVRAGDLSFARIDVKLSVRDGDYIEVLGSDLKPGMEVVARGGHVLKSEWVLNHLASSP